MILQTEELRYVYSENTPFEKTAVDNVSISIEENDFIGLIGHTGSGKSTLVQHLNGLLKPTSGKIYFDGQDISDKDFDIKALRFKVGLVFQYPEYQLFDETVEKDISFGPRNMGLDEAQIKERVVDAANAVGLKPELLSRSPFDLSGGEKRRAAIAGVIAMQPKVLILDEPTAGLDPLGRNTILDMLSKYRREHNTTVVLVSHSMEDVAKVADKAIVMDHGKVAIYDTVEKVFSNAERLEKIGLNVPEITKIFSALRSRGIDLPDDVYTVDRALSVLLPILKKGAAK